jgi:hypothetical protein
MTTTLVLRSLSDLESVFGSPRTRRLERERKESEARNARLREARFANDRVDVKVTATFATLYPLPAGTLTMTRKVAVLHRHRVVKALGTSLPIGERNAFAAMLRRLDAAL